MTVSCRIGAWVFGVVGLVVASRAQAVPTQVGCGSAPNGPAHVVCGNAAHGVVAGTINGPVTINDNRRIEAARSDPALARKAQELGVAQGAFNAFFNIVGEANVSPDQYEAKLIEYAERYKVLAQGLAAVPDAASPQIAALKAKAQQALDGGHFDAADALLQKIEEAQRAAASTRLADLSATETSRANIGMTRLKYLDAAKHFAEAAALAPEDQTKLAAFDFEANAYYRQGDEFGDRAALATAITRYRDLIDLRPRDRVPLEWARTQMNLGNALDKLGERERGTESLEKAVAAYSAALTENTRDRVPLEWAMTQMNLGNALDEVGEHESGTATLEKAAEAYNAALLENTRARAPLNWARIQMNLGITFKHLGERESGTESLEKSVAAYSAALTETTRDRVPLEWARTQVNLGNALATLGERESGTASLEKAVAAYSVALMELTRDRVPMEWARTQVGLDYTQFLMATRRNDLASLSIIEDHVAEARSVALGGGDEREATFADYVLSQIAAAKAKPGG